MQHEKGLKRKQTSERLPYETAHLSVCEQTPLFYTRVFKAIFDIFTDVFRSVFEFFDALAKTFGQFGDFFRAEQQEQRQEDKDHLLTAQTHN